MFQVPDERHFQEPEKDQWSMDFLDERIPPLLEDAGLRKIKTKLRRMRTRARMADQLMDNNRELRRIVRETPYVAPTGQGYEHIPTAQTRAQVVHYASIRLPKRDICRLMNLSLPTLNLYYSDEVEQGRAQLTSKVLDTYIAMATNPEHPQAEKAARTYLERHVPGWKEVKRVETAQVGEKPTRKIDITILTPEERVQWRAMLEKMLEARQRGEEPAQLTDESIVSEQDGEISEDADGVAE